VGAPVRGQALRRAHGKRCAPGRDLPRSRRRPWAGGAGPVPPPGQGGEVRDLPRSSDPSRSWHPAFSSSREILRKLKNYLRDGLEGKAVGSSDVCVPRGVGITVQINSATERRMWDVFNLPPFKPAAEASRQNFINKTW